MNLLLGKNIHLSIAKSFTIGCTNWCIRLFCKEYVEGKLGSYGTDKSLSKRLSRDALSKINTLHLAI